jgi:ATP-dependent Clp protease ATP-binding subunit ClpC
MAKKTIVPIECYTEYGKDLDGCSRQENQGCAGCKCLVEECSSVIERPEEGWKRFDDIKKDEIQTIETTCTVNDFAIMRLDKEQLKEYIEGALIGQLEGFFLQNLESILHQRVVGQEEAVGAVAKAIRRGRVGLKDPNRPIGSFLFLGPTGVGKTELSKALAEAMFGSENSIIRVDMSEYMEKHSVSKLIGSPPGYVGYDEGGQLSEKVRQNPYSVILFDEIEKAHPDVFNILLQVLDDGHITDAQGRKVSFKNTIIIMTSNAGAQNIIAPKRLGFTSVIDEKEDYKRMKEGVMDEVKKIFKPEFINRIDEIIVFHSLSKEDIKSIVVIMIASSAKRSKSQMNISLETSDEVVAHLAEVGFDPKYGARPLRRAIQTNIEYKLAEAILAGTIKEGDSVRVEFLDNEKVVQTKQPAVNQ